MGVTESTRDVPTAQFKIIVTACTSGSTIAISPDGTTAYIVSDISDSVTPINAAGKPIKFGIGPDLIAIAA